MYAAKRVKTERRLSGKQEQTRRPAKPHIYTATNHTMRQQKIKGKSVLCGGARRNRTADNGFADHCLTTWRPRHRAKSVQLSVISSPLKKGRFKSHRVNGDLRAKTGEESSPLAPYSVLHMQTLSIYWKILLIRIFSRDGAQRAAPLKTSAARFI